jgi:DNA polymerase elongation subunit (family B)
MNNLRGYNKKTVNTNEDIIFNAIDWKSYDIIDENDEDSNEDNDDEDAEYDSDDGEKKPKKKCKYTVRCFGVNRNGESVHLKINNFKPYFYIQIPDNWTKAKWTKLITIVKERMPWYAQNSIYEYTIEKKKNLYWFKNNKLDTFLKIVFNNNKGMSACERIFREPIKMSGETHLFELFCSNIDPILSLLHTNNLLASGWIICRKGKYLRCIESNCQIDIEADWTNVEFIDIEEIAPLIVASFDIECKSKDGSFPNASRPEDEIIQIGTTVHKYGEKEVSFKHIATLKKCNPIEGAVVESYETEVDLLIGWKKFILALDPDIMTGWNILGFDFKYIYDRVVYHNIENRFLTMCKVKNKPGKYTEKKLESSALGENLLKYIDFDGRIIVDLMKYVQKEAKLDSYKLDAVAEHYLDEHKVDLSPKELFENYKIGTPEKITEIAVYCIQDCVLCNRLMIKLEVVPNNVGMSNVCHVPFYWLFLRGQGVKIQSLVSKFSMEKEFLIPRIKCEVYTMKYGRLETYRWLFNTHKKKYSKQWIETYIVKLKDETVCDKIAFIKSIDEVHSYMRELSGQGIEISDDTVIELKEYVDGTYEGAIVLEPTPQMYLDIPVSVLDFASLYPSSMISENISHNTLVWIKYYDKNGEMSKFYGSYEYDNLPGITYNDVEFENFSKVNDVKVSDGRVVCRYADNVDGVIPNILDMLLFARRKTRASIDYKLGLRADGSYIQGFFKEKDEHYEFTEYKQKPVLVPKSEIVEIKQKYQPFQQAVIDGLQLAYKITANSLYGQVGAGTSAIYLKELAACTTATGRKLITFSRDYIEKTFKHAKVVYGDTDSVFINFKPHWEKELGLKLEGRDALVKSIELAMESGHQITALLKKPHDLEYEKTFFPFIQFAKKRYVGNLYEENPDKFKEKSMGIALKRRDFAEITKKIYGGCIKILLNERDFQKSIQFFIDECKKLLKGEVDIKDLIISKTLRSSYANPEGIAHYMLNKRIQKREPGKEYSTNERIPYVYVQTKPKRGVKELQADKIEHPSYILNNPNIKPDFRYYLDHQVKNACIQLFGLGLEQIPGYKNGWLDETKLRNLDEEKRRDKLIALKEAETERLLIGRILIEDDNKRNGNAMISKFFTPVSRDTMLQMQEIYGNNEEEPEWKKMIKRKKEEGVGKGMIEEKYINNEIDEVNEEEQTKVPKESPKEMIMRLKKKIEKESGVKIEDKTKVIKVKKTLK